MRSEEQRRLLGQFIRSHREGLTPDLPTARRRTPGLRREELAARAGIGATWCAWIEQGRDVSVSPEALRRLAMALALTPAERAYLFELAGRRDPDAPAPHPAADAPEALHAMVGLIAHPAYGLDRLWNACCWNEAARQLFAPWLEGDGPHNLLRYVFTQDTARALIPDWENRATRLLAEFRADYGRALDDPRAVALVDQLKAESPFFAQVWDRQAVVAREGGLRGFVHPTQGLIAYRQHTLHPSERGDYKLVALVPFPSDEG
jgi:transcriptional regulator with XRE-family HTH domain